MQLGPEVIVIEGHFQFSMAYGITHSGVSTWKVVHPRILACFGSCALKSHAMKL